MNQKTKGKIEEMVSERVPTLWVSTGDGGQKIAGKETFEFLIEGIEQLVDEVERDALKLRKNKSERKGYCLRFYTDKDKIANLKETNDGDSLSPGDMWLFGCNIAESKLLDDKDKRAFSLFCQGYLSEYSEESPSKIEEIIDDAYNKGFEARRVSGYHGEFLKELKSKYLKS